LICQDVFDMDVTGYHLLFMALTGPVLFGITLLIELNESVWLRHGPAPPPPTIEDEDVAAGTNKPDTRTTHALDTEAYFSRIEAPWACFGGGVRIWNPKPPPRKHTWQYGFLNRLHGGGAHPLAACGVATRCCWKP
jgi:hypothetical protein